MGLGFKYIVGEEWRVRVGAAVNLTTISGYVMGAARVNQRDRIILIHGAGIRC